MAENTGGNAKLKVDDKSSRRVSNMTAMQVEKKRAIDRANQRHCRNKQKTRMESLEKQVAELSRKLAEANERLSRYESQLPLSPPPSTVTMASPRQLPPLPAASPLSGVHNNHFGAADSGLLSSLGAPCSGYGDGPAGLVRFAGSIDSSRTQSMSLDFDLGMTVDIMDSGKEFRFLDFGLESSVYSPGYQDETAPFEGSTSQPASDSITVLGPSPETDETLWQTIPLHTSPPICELEKLVHGVLAAARPLTSNELNEASFPSISSLLNPDEEADRSRPLSVLAAAQVFKSSVQKPTERFAFMYVLAQLLRWYVRRDKQSFDHLPEFIKPTRLQRTVPHPAWIDLVTWPDVRDNIIQHMDWDEFPAFRELTGGTLSVEWPYADSGAILESADGRQLALNPMFKAHIRDVKNWSIGPEPCEKFPFLKPWARQAAT